MAHKFKVGQTVTILSRKKEGNWENTNAGGSGIVERTHTQDHGYADTNLYSLWLVFDDGITKSRSCYWYEEKYLQMECSNEERGLKILNKRNE